jgi:hypothetical protein
VNLPLGKENPHEDLVSMSENWIPGRRPALVDYYHAIRLGLPLVPGQLGATYVIPILYVPMLMITHAVAFYWLARPLSGTNQAVVGKALASLR